MQRRGVPGIVVVSEVFKPLADIEAQTLGYPDMAMIVMPHPIGQRERVDLEELMPAAGRELDAMFMQGN